MHTHVTQIGSYVFCEIMCILSQHHAIAKASLYEEKNGNRLFSLLPSHTLFLLIYSTVFFMTLRTRAICLSVPLIPLTTISLLKIHITHVRISISFIVK